MSRDKEPLVRTKETVLKELVDLSYKIANENNMVKMKEMYDKFMELNEEYKRLNNEVPYAPV